MGQAVSDNSLPVAIENMQDDILRHTRVLTEISALTYEEFQSRLFQLNQLSRKCVDNDGHQLIFAIKRGSDKSLLWKGTVKIACVRINYDTQKVVSYRLLTLIEFLKVFKTLQNQFAAAEQSRENSSLTNDDNGPFDSSSTSNQISPCSTSQCSTNTSVPVPPESILTYTQVTASFLLDELDSAASAAQSKERLSECCICLERKPEVLLPCTHSYCLPCIEQWNVNHKTCPICREALESTDDTWVISEAPEAQEICGSLMELSKTMPHNH